jgi:hypothetical protein
MATAGSLERPSAERRDFDPFRSTWRLLTNVKFAMILVATAALVGMIGVVIPQLPAEMKGNPAAQSAWYALRVADFGRFARPMDRAGLFDVYHQWWFYALWGVIITSVTVCTVSRIRPTVRSIHLPPREVSEAYFETAHHRASFALPGDVASLENALRRRRYRVERVRQSGGQVYLFAERYGWSQYGTFVSHLALIMVLVGGLLTTMAGFDRTLALAETSGAAPVFDTPGRDQIFIGMQDAVRRIDAGGNIVDFRSFLELRRGDEVVQCVATVNDPCNAFGYRFHQAAFFADLARIEITGPDDRLLYADVLDFNANQTPAPFLTVTRDGVPVFEQPLPQLGSEDTLATSLLAFTARNGVDISIPVAWQNVDGQMVVYLDDGVGGLQAVRAGESTAILAGVFEVQFDGVAAIPAIEFRDLPGALGGIVTVQMPPQADGSHLLVLDGVDTAGPLFLAAGDAATTTTGHTYRFVGQVDGAGINIKRDPGDTFIFIAVILALIGLAMTFYLPRRRLWARVRDGRADLAGIAERTTRLSRELRIMGAELGSTDALLPEDHEERW